MSIVPDTRIGKIEFFEAHVSPWRANAAAIGITSGQVTAVQTLTAEARAAFNAHQAAQNAAKAATERFYNAVAALQDEGSDVIRAIKTKAETEDDANVYVLAAIPAPATPSPTPPPGTPTAFRVELLQTGAVKLTWKCPNPEGTQGTVYEIKRRLGGETAEFVYIGVSGVKQFVDETLPVGPSSVTYQITAIRSTRSGSPARFLVTFGVGEGGAAVSSPQVREAMLRGGGLRIEIPEAGANGANGQGQGHATRRPGKNRAARRGLGV